MMFQYYVHYFLISGALMNAAAILSLSFESKFELFACHLTRYQLQTCQSMNGFFLVYRRAWLTAIWSLNSKYMSVIGPLNVWTNTFLDENVSILVNVQKKNTHATMLRVLHRWHESNIAFLLKFEQAYTVVEISLNIWGTCYELPEAIAYPIHTCKYMHRSWWLSFSQHSHWGVRKNNYYINPYLNLDNVIPTRTIVLT